VLREQNDGVARNMYSVVIAPAEPPDITGQPKYLILEEGLAGQIKVNIQGIPNPQLQWFYGGSPVSGATNRVLSLPVFTRAQEGIFWLVASNSVGQATSAPIAVVVGNVEPETFVGLSWEGSATQPQVLESSSRLGPAAVWHSISNYPPGQVTWIFVASKDVEPACFYRLHSPIPASFTGAGLVNGWWFPDVAGSRHLIEYTGAANGWTNWQVLTNLILPVSPYLFLDYESLGQARRVYRTTPQP